MTTFGAGDDLARVAKSVTLRAGRGKSRNRRFTVRRGPLIVYDEENAPFLKAFRNIPGVDAVNVHKLSILKLAPGGTLGRFIVWSSAAFKALDHIFGTYSHTGVEKGGYQLQRNIMTHPDVSAIIKSEAVQSVLRPLKDSAATHQRKKDPYRNKEVMDKLNPFYRLKKRIDLIKSRRHSK